MPPDATRPTAPRARPSPEDPDVVGAAITGSHATDDGDRWSDLDLALAVFEC